MAENFVFYLAALAAVLLTGISKSGFGGGLGVLAVPLMSLAAPPQFAAAVMLPLLIVMDAFTVRHYCRSWDRRNLTVLLPAAIAGIVIGSRLFPLLNAAQVRILVGTIALLFSLNYFVGFSAVERKPSLSAGIFWGSVAGFTSFGVHAGGPPLDIYLLPQKMPKTMFVGTTVVFFAVVNLIKVVPYVLLGQLTAESLKVSLLLAPVAPLGVRLGLILHRRIDERLFYRLCYLFLGIVGLKLLVDGFLNG